MDFARAQPIQRAARSGGRQQQIFLDEQFAHVAERFEGILFRRHQFEAVPQFAPRLGPAHPHRLVDIGAGLRQRRQPAWLWGVLDHDGWGDRESSTADCTSLRNEICSNGDM